MILLYKTIYCPAVNIVLRNIARLINSIFKFKIKFPVSGILTLKSPLGKTFKLKTNETCYVGNYIYWNGVQSYESTALFCELLAKFDSIIDIGANVGLFTVLGGIHNPNAHIYAFDPAHGSALYTNYNIKLNQLANASVFELAVSDRKGETSFHEVLLQKYLYIKEHLSGSSSLNGVHKMQGKKYCVKTISLDDFVSENNIHNVDFIKIDAEMAEPMIIKGAEKLIARFLPIIYCEVIYGCMKDMCVITSNENYNVYNIKYNTLEKIENAVDYVYTTENNFLFVPKQKTLLIRKFIV